MLFPPAEIVSFHSDVMTLEPGGPFSTETPRTAPIAPGDHLQATVESIGSVEANEVALLALRQIHTGADYATTGDGRSTAVSNQ